MSDVPGYQDYTGLFRFFQLSGVKLTLSFRNNAATSGEALPIVMTSWAPELAVNSAPTTFAAFRERQNIKKYYPGTRRTISKYLKPRLAQVVDDINGTEAFGMDFKPKWILTEYPTHLHTGLLVNFDTTGITTETTIDIEAVYYFRFKGPQ